jgi:hypothetical protein
VPEPNVGGPCGPNAAREIVVGAEKLLSPILIVAVCGTVRLTCLLWMTSMNLSPLASPVFSIWKRKRIVLSKKPALAFSEGVMKPCAVTASTAKLLSFGSRKKYTSAISAPRSCATIGASRWSAARAGPAPPNPNVSAATAAAQIGLKSDRNIALLLRPRGRGERKNKTP